MRDFLGPAPGGVIGRLPRPVRLPRWLAEADLCVFEDELRLAGAAGALSYFEEFEASRTQLREKLGGKIDDATIRVPALLAFGERDDRRERDVSIRAYRAQRLAPSARASRARAGRGREDVGRGGARVPGWVF